MDTVARRPGEQPTGGDVERRRELDETSCRRQVDAAFPTGNAGKMDAKEVCKLLLLKVREGAGLSDAGPDLLGRGFEVDHGRTLAP
jgi:hypothetical protein